MPIDCPSSLSSFRDRSLVGASWSAYDARIIRLAEAFVVLAATTASCSSERHGIESSTSSASFSTTSTASSPAQASASSSASSPSAEASAPPRLSISALGDEALKAVHAAAQGCYRSAPPATRRSKSYSLRVRITQDASGKVRKADSSTRSADAMSKCICALFFVTPFPPPDHWVDGVGDRVLL